MSSFSKTRRINPALRPNAVPNAVLLWESRLAALEKAPATPERDQEVDGLTQLMRAVFNTATRELLMEIRRVPNMMMRSTQSDAVQDSPAELTVIRRVTLGRTQAGGR